MRITQSVLEMKFYDLDKSTLELRNNISNMNNIITTLKSELLLLEAEFTKYKQQKHYCDCRGCTRELSFGNKGI